ncbi:MAG: aspartate--tRNA ligase [Alphaproteobacteria bacterium]|tara:strand:- start:445 stop:2223 length:1779 start_codon:yes stop_codon:yes gene_type:complete
MNKFRTHNCGELSQTDENQEVILSGWVNKKRDHGGLLFIDLRDHYGVTQCVFDLNIKNFDKIESLKLESVLKISGKVVKRSKDTVNKGLSTGLIEIVVDNFTILNESEQIPFQIAINDDAPEEQRLKFRYLDLRREKIHQNIILRSKVINSIREKMISRGFLEIQTPILTASSPEGARDFLVPSRLNQGKFYALPQAPQIFKQLLMVSSFDKYFQIAPCFRDEDARADRSPGEFYQLDFEMSFVEQEDVLNEIEPVLYEIFTKYSEKQVSKPPFKRIKYKDSIEKYGTDKPDLRNPLLISDLTECFVDSGFKIFENNIKNGQVVKGIRAPQSSEKSRAWFDKLNNWARDQGQKGLGYIIFSGGEFKGPIANNLKKEKLEQIKVNSSLKDGDSIFFISDSEIEATRFCSIVRKELCDQLNLLKKDVYEFCWIVDFPMFEIDSNKNKLDFSHNPFSMPQGGMDSLLNKNPLEILAWQFDIVCNGIELSSGAIRNHKPEIMIKAFEIAGYSIEDLKEKFGFLFNAFKFGAPPHGGSAPGIDRIIMLLSNEENLREVVAFPMNQQAEDLMLGSPTSIGDKHLKELGVNIIKKRETT